MTPAMVSRQLGSGQLGIRYGFRNQDEFQAFAATGVLSPGLRSTVSLTGGVTDANCIGCDIAVLAGLGVDYRVFDAGDPMGKGTSLTIALGGDAGYARVKPGDEDAWTFGIGAPITLSFALGGQEGLHLVPYFTPVFGYGSTSGPCLLVVDCDKSGTRWVLGGGVGLWNPLSIVSVSVGVNQVMQSGGGKMLVGINAMVGR